MNRSAVWTCLALFSAFPLLAEEAPPAPAPAPTPAKVGVLGVQLDAEAGIVSVVPGSPAETAGLAAGDKILSVDGKAMGTDEIREAVKNSPGRELVLKIQRGEQELEIKVTPKGIAPQEP